MVASGICTASQYEAGKDKLLDHIARSYDLSGSVDGVVPTAANQTSNQWSDDDDNEEAVFVSPNLIMAETELANYELYDKSRYQPVLKPTKTLGSYDGDGNL